jgi:hypothetical protein
MFFRCQFAKGCVGLMFAQELILSLELADEQEK